MNPDKQKEVTDYMRKNPYCRQDDVIRDCKIDKMNGSRFYLKGRKILYPSKSLNRP